MASELIAQGQDDQGQEGGSESPIQDVTGPQDAQDGGQQNIRSPKRPTKRRAGRKNTGAEKAAVKAA